MKTIAPEIITVLFDAVSHWFDITGKQTEIIIKKPNFIGIDFLELSHTFQAGKYTSFFYTLFEDVDGFDFLLSLFDNVITTFYPTKYYLYFKNLKKLYEFTGIRHLNPEVHTGKILCVRAVLRSVTEKLNKIDALSYTCPACGAVDYIALLSDFMFLGNTRCKVCKKRIMKFDKEIKKQVIRVKIEEPTESSETHRKSCYVYGELKAGVVDYYISQNINAGDRVILIVKLVNNPTVKGMAISQFFFNIYSIEKDREREEQYSITNEDIKKLIDESKKEGFVKKLISSIAPQIEGYDDVKLGLLIQENSGTNEDVNVWEEPTVNKNQVHIILAGAPASGKTFLSKFLLNVSPKSYFASGDQSSIAGLLGTVYQDPMLQNEWSLSAGAFAIANGGTIIIDELNKLDSKEISRLNQVLSDYKVSFDKAKVNTTIYTVVKLLGIMNPIGDTWKKSDGLTQQKIIQLNLKRAFTTRVSLIFPFYEDDLDTSDKVERALKRKKGMLNTDEYFSEDFLRKYFSYVKKKKVVFNNDELIQKQKEFYEKIYEPKLKEHIKAESNNGNSNTEQPAKMRVLNSYEALLSGLARTNINEGDTCSPLPNHYEIVEYLLQEYYLSMFFKTEAKYWEQAGVNIQVVNLGKLNALELFMEWIKGTKKEYNYQEMADKWFELTNEPETKFAKVFERLNTQGDILKMGNDRYVPN